MRLLALLFLLGSVGFLIVATSGGSPDADQAQGPAAGKWVFVDPDTGEFSSRKPEGFASTSLSPRLQDAFSRSSEGLQKVASPVPGGGTMVSTRGRFKCAQVAVPDGRGGLKFVCGANCLHRKSEGRSR